jgi:pyruvate dehydrogenase E2 component (dihydrolipoamide acetyltransferase)
MTSRIPISMPRLSDSMEEGTLLRWLKSDGQPVKVRDDLAEIESDKATVVYEAEFAGVLTTVAAEGATVAVGTLIAWLSTKERSSDDSNQSGLDSSVSVDVSPIVAAMPPDVVRQGAVTASPRRRASPLARRMAAQHGINLQDLDGTGPGGRVTRNDVALRIGSPESKPSPADSAARGVITTHTLTRAQMLVAERVAQSRCEIPHFEVRARVDAEEIDTLRKQLKADAPASVPSINDFVVAAAAVALREQPRANGRHRGDEWQLYGRVNVGIAVAVDEGLVVPTIFDADQKSLGEIARTTRDLSARAREGRITPADVDGGTFTVSNLGMFGVDSFSAVIPAQQAAILAVGAAVRVPVVREDRIVPGLAFDLTLACDHRILYGADAARLLSRIRELLEHPLCLLAR